MDIHYVKLENPSANCVPWEGLEDSPFTKMIGHVLVGHMTAQLKSSMGTVLYKPRLTVGGAGTERGSLIVRGRIGS